MSDDELKEPLGLLDLEELPETYGIDECEVMCQTPRWVFVYWEVTPGGLSAAEAQLGPSAAGARRVLRLYSTVNGKRELRDQDIDWNHGRRYLQVPRPGAHVRLAVGLLSPEGYFAPIAHSSVVKMPPEGPAAPGEVEWLEVPPARTRGLSRERLAPRRPGAQVPTARVAMEAPPAAPGSSPSGPGHPPIEHPSSPGQPTSPGRWGGAS